MFTVIYNIGAGVLRAVGDSRSPFLILVVSSLFNIILDLVFVAAFHWDIAGVGIATVLSQLLSVLLVYRAMQKSEKEFRLDFASLKTHRAYVGEILNVGLPAGMQGSIISISNIFIWRYVNSFDSTAITAGVGVAMRLDKFVSLPTRSIGLAMTTLTGQNAGAGKHSRSRRGVVSGLLLSAGVSVFMGLIVYLAAPALVSLFNQKEEIVSVGVDMMRTIIPFYASLAVIQIFFGVLRGYRDTRIPMLISWVGMVICRQAYLALSMSLDRRIWHVYFCYPVAWISTAVLIVGYYMLRRKKLGIAGPDREEPGPA
jgi:putative MATE family efflux protein